MIHVTTFMVRALKCCFILHPRPFNSGRDLSSVTSDSDTSHIECWIIPLSSSGRIKIFGVTAWIQKLKQLTMMSSSQQSLLVPFAIGDERIHFWGRSLRAWKRFYNSYRAFWPVFNGTRWFTANRKTCQRPARERFRDIYLLDRLSSSLSRHSVVLSDLLATILITNSAFQDRARQRVEHYGRTTNHIYVSMESTK